MQLMTIICQQPNTELGGAFQPLVEASVYVYDAGTTDLSAIYDSADNPTNNPLTSDNNGLAAFAAADGKYDVQVISKDGSFIATLLEKVQLSDAADDLVVDSVTLGHDPTDPMHAATKQYVDAGDTVGAVVGPASATDGHIARFDGTSGKLIKSGILLSTDGTFAGASDATVATQLATKTLSDTKVTGPASAVGDDFVQFNSTTGKLVKDGGLSLSTDGTFASNSDVKVPSQKAAKTYADLKAALAGAAFTGQVSISIPGGGVNYFDMAGELNTSVRLSRYGVAPPSFEARTARGTIASPSVVATNDLLRTDTAWGYATSGAAGFVKGGDAYFSCIEPAPTSTAMGGSWTLRLSPLGSVVPTPVLYAAYDAGLALRGSFIFDQNRHQFLRQYATGALPAATAGAMAASSDIVGATMVGNGTFWMSPGVVQQAFTANGTVTVPPGFAIAGIYYTNASANTVTGGIKIGTSSGGTEVVVAQAAAAGTRGHITDATILKRWFDYAAATTLYVQAVTAWNSATVALCFHMVKVT